MDSAPQIKILITGGAGFIGSNFVCSALGKGHQVINIDALTYAGSLTNLDGYFSHPSHHFYKQDICNQDEVQKIILKHEPDIIIHMAAESHVDRSIDNPDDFIRTNIVGTHSLLQGCLKYCEQLGKDKENAFKFIHLSTDEVFGALGKIGKFTESSPYKPNSPYAASKASADHLVKSFHQTYGFPAIIVNSSNNYGARQYPEKLIPLTILNALEGKPLPIYGDGQQVRDWLHVEDHVEALFSLIKHGKTGESYCIGSDNEMTNLMLVEQICDILDQTQPTPKSYRDLITFVVDRPGHDFRYATDASKLKEHTNWSPRVSLIGGLNQTVKWYLERFDVLSANSQARSRIGLSA